MRKSKISKGEADTKRYKGQPNAIPQETKVLIAQLKVDLMDILDAQDPLSQPAS